MKFFWGMANKRLYCATMCVRVYVWACVFARVCMRVHLLCVGVCVIICPTYRCLGGPRQLITLFRSDNGEFEKNTQNVAVLGA